MSTAGFVHETCVYASDEQFLGTAVPFVQQGLAAGDPVLVATTSATFGLLADALGEQSDQVDHADSAHFGQHAPQRVAGFYRYWQLHSPRLAAGRRLRVIAEPVWASGRPSEVRAGKRMEAGLNLIFGHTAVHMICPYDMRVVDPEIADESRRTHPSEAAHGTSQVCSEFMDPRQYAAECDAHPLPDPPPFAVTMQFDGDLGKARHFVAGELATQGLHGERAELFVLAVNEVLTYVKAHEAVAVTVRLWSDSEASVCEVHAATPMQSDPYLGFYPPGTPDGEGTEGLWVARQVCEAAEIRSGHEGWRVQLRVPGARAVEESQIPYPA